MSIVFHDIDLKKEEEIENFLQKAVGVELFRDGWERLLTYLKDILPEVKKTGIKITTIAGTNGKGETATTLSYLLHQNNFRTALWLSPHILSIRERMLFNMKPLSYEEFFSNIKRTQDKAKKLNIEFSYYELLFCAFLEILLVKNKEEKIDHLILEVGIGGRLDAVNLLDADLAAITSISRDHQDILGKGFKKILNEKMGIMRKNKPVYTAFELNYLRDIVSEKAKEFNSSYVDLFDRDRCNKCDSYSVRNRLLALSLLNHHLGKNLPEKKDLEKMNFPSLKGRSEVMTLDGRRFIFVGSHNLDGIRKLIESIKDNLEIDSILVAFSKRSYAEEVNYLLKMFTNNVKQDVPLYITHFDHAKAHKFSDKVLEGLTKSKRKVEYVDDFKKFVVEKNNGAKDLLVTGSFYFVGTVQNFLVEKGATLS